MSYEYDENGYLIRSIDVYGIEHEYEYEYDENGYLVQTDRERKKRSFANMKKNFYNKDGKLAKSPCSKFFINIFICNNRNFSINQW